MSVLYCLFLSVLLILSGCSRPVKEKETIPVLCDTPASAGVRQPVPENPEKKRIWKNKVFQLPPISAVKAEFPLRIYRINFEDHSKRLAVNAKVRSKIEGMVREYFFDECGGDSSDEYCKMKDVYFNTICLEDSLYTVYMVLRHCCLPDYMDCTVLFYNNLTNEFVNSTFDLSIYALYDLYNDKLKIGNLKDRFLKGKSEAELIDYDGDGVSDFKFTGLIHNGTFNAIETTILKVRDHGIDTLYYDRKEVGPLTKKT